MSIRKKYFSILKIFILVSFFIAPNLNAQSQSLGCHPNNPIASLISQGVNGLLNQAIGDQARTIFQIVRRVFGWMTRDVST